MKKYLFLLLIIFLQSCATTSTTTNNTAKTKGANYQYVFTLVKPKEDSALIFEDEKIKIAFEIGRKSVNFALKNKTNENMKVLWDEAALVLMGSAERIMHKGVKYTDKSLAQPSTSVPPGSTLTDLVLPVDNIYYREGYYGVYYSNAGGWEERDLFLSIDNNRIDTRTSILKLKNAVFSFYLPLQQKGGTLEYNFEFKIKDIKQYYGDIIAESKSFGGETNNYSITINHPFGKIWNGVLDALVKHNISVSSQNINIGEITTGKYISNSFSIENTDGSLQSNNAIFALGCEKEENTGKCKVPKSIEADLVIKLIDKGDRTQVSVNFINIKAWMGTDKKTNKPEYLQNVRSTGVFEKQFTESLN